MTARPAFHTALAPFSTASTASTAPTADHATSPLTAIEHLDRLWAEAQRARPEAALDASALQAYTGKRRDAAVLYPHAAARWAWFDDTAALITWPHARCYPQHTGETAGARGGGVLITRPQERVQWRPLNAAGFAFLNLFARGGTYAQAADAARATPTGARMDELLATLLHAGAFNRISLTHVSRRLFAFIR